MEKVIIKFKELGDNRVRIESIANVLTRKELPKEYYKHVPYMFWRTWEGADPEEEYLFINYIGGIDELRVGEGYSRDKVMMALEHVEICKRKLHDVLHAADESLERAAAYIAGLTVGREDVDDASHPVWLHLKEEYRESYRRRARRVVELAQYRRQDFYMS